MDYILQVGVKALLQNSKGEYLLLKRSLEKYPDIDGRWDIVGGRINPGETLLENLKREIREETSLEIIDLPVLISAQDILRNDKHVVRLTYRGSVQGEVKLDPKEHDQFKWLTLKQLKNFDDLDIYFKEILKDL